MRALLLSCLIVASCMTTPRSVVTPQPFAPSPSTSPSPTPVATQVSAPSAAPLVDLRTEGCVDADARVGEPALCPVFMSADLDGDGRDDEISIYLPGHETRRALPFTWTLTLRTAHQFVKGTATAGWLPPMAVFGLLGTTDMNGDGRPDALLAVGNGASTTWVAILTFDGKGIREIVGDPMLLIGGSVRHGDAIECRHVNDRYELVHRQISDYTALDQWDVVERVYVWRGNDLVLNSISKWDFRFPVGQVWPPELSRIYYGIDCGSFRRPS